MASIEKRGDGYRIVVSAGMDINNKQIKKTMMFYPTTQATTPKKKHDEALAAAVQFEQDVLTGKYNDKGKMRFSRFVELWKKDYGKENLTEYSYENYCRRLEKEIIPIIGNKKLSDIRQPQIQEIIDTLKKRKVNGRPIKRRTIQRYLNITSSVLSKAVKWGYIDENPCRRAEIPKEKKLDFTKHCFSVEEAKVFINSLRDTYTVTKKAHYRTIKKTGTRYLVPEYTEQHSLSLQFQCLFLILLHTGMRRGECLALTWEDIDFENGEIDISKNATCVNGEQKIKTPKTVNGYRKIAISPEIVGFLKRWRTEQQTMSLELFCWQGYKGKDFDKNYLFIQDNGEQMHLSTPTHKFTEFIKYHNMNCEEEEKLPVIRLHDLRHCSATFLLTNGIDVTATANRLGHSSPYVTLKYYAENLKSADHEASEKMAEILAI